MQTRMQTSFPYLRISRLMGCDYGRVLAIVEKLDAGYSSSAIDDPLVGNVYRVWADELQRRRDASNVH